MFSIVFILLIPNCFANLTLDIDLDYAFQVRSCIEKFIDRRFTPDNFVQFVDSIKKDPDDWSLEIIMDEVLETVHADRILNPLIEITNGSRIQFNSTRVCLSNCEAPHPQRVYRSLFKTYRKADYYITFADNVSLFEETVEKLTFMRSYNSSALMLVYYKRRVSKPRDVAKLILLVLNNFAFYNSLVLVPAGDSPDELHLFSLNLFGRATESCGWDAELRLNNVCQNGEFLMQRDRNFEVYQAHHGLNCTLGLVLVHVPPFVINDENGCEVEVLRVLKESLNISYNVTYIKNSVAWGTYENGEWTGLLKIIEEDPFKLGVGRATVTTARLKHFAFAQVYYTEPMIWVVPAAEYLPPWLAIFSIFEVKLWIILFVILIFSGLIMTLLARYHPEEFEFMKDFGSSMVISVQVLLSSPARNQPKSRSVRIIFIHYAVVMIVISCLYQSGLIDVLTNRRKERQIDSEEEVFDSGIGIGGMSYIRDIFNISQSYKDMYIYKIYEIYHPDNDTLFMWLHTVAKDRDTITILGEYFTEYFNSIQDPRIVNHDGGSKVHLIKDEPLYMEQISIIFSKGYFLQEQIDDIVSALVTSGLIEKWKDEAMRIKLDNYITDEEDEHDHNDAVVMTLEHIQGVFVIILFGHLLGFVAFLLENVYYLAINHLRCTLFKRKPYFEFAN